jgi:hypothetical protein
MNKQSTLLTALAASIVAFTLSAQSAEPWVGTWKLNYDKSKYSSAPASKGFIRKVESLDGGLKETGDVIDMKGQPLSGPSLVLEPFPRQWRRGHR